ncbi:MAG TPA: hypothetical protein VN084_00375, partial [Methylophilaceae bacterium]|nr:hypothetical protein [Methylophilaceae bacterium]
MSVPVWELPRRADYTLQINISRNTLIAVCFSILLHLLLLLWLKPTILLPDGAQGKPQPITVTLNAPIKPAAPQAEAVVEPPPPVVQPHPAKPKPVRSRPQKTQPDVMAVEKVTPDAIAKVPAPASTPEPEAAPTDMMSYVKAAQAKRQAAENYAAQINADAAAR